MVVLSSLAGFALSLASLSFSAFVQFLSCGSLGFYLSGLHRFFNVSRSFSTSGVAHVETIIS